ncbi:MAG: hypothetical protein QG594_578 [Bacteroidota bacterium]|nr:hypothetical protein [Bacteroidota bacterium]
MAEWLKALVLKSKVLQDTVGSNPTLPLYYLTKLTKKYAFFNYIITNIWFFKW